MNIAAENEHPKDSAENEPRGPVTVRAVPGAEHLRDRHEYVRRVGGADSALGPTTLAHSRIFALFRPYLRKIWQHLRTHTSALSHNDY